LGRVRRQKPGKYWSKTGQKWMNGARELRRFIFFDAPMGE
jgi:hypothetical protein